MEIRHGQHEGLTRHMRQVVVPALQLAADGLGEPDGGRTEEQGVPFRRRDASGRVDVIEPDLRVGSHRLYPSFPAMTILNVEVRGRERLGDEETLLAKCGEELRFPHARMEIRGLTVAGPRPIGIGQGEIKLVQGPRGQVMRWT